MKRWLVLCLGAVLLITSGLGCGGRQQRDVNKDKDMPKSAEKNE